MLNDEQRRSVEEHLLRERAEAMEAVGRRDGERPDLREMSGELGVLPSHPADVGTEAHEQEKAMILAGAESQRLYDIEGALERLQGDPRGFGRCSDCGAEIEWARLELIPETTVCAAHAT